MSKLRVHELAKELNISSKELISLLMKEFNVEVKNHMSTIEDEDAALIKELLSDSSEAKAEASAEGKDKKSLVDVYEDELAEQLNKGTKKKKKNGKYKEESVKDEDNNMDEAQIIEIGESITVKELAEKLNKPSNDVIRLSLIHI